MDQTRLRSLLAIAEHGGFGRAAAALGLAPSLSRQIALLEQEVGRPLLYRHGRGARLTEDGQRLADAARPLLTALANLPSALDDPVPRGRGARRAHLHVRASGGVDLRRAAAALPPAEHPPRRRLQRLHQPVADGGEARHRHPL
ncbi:LysR family transcriptional regulator [Teichococcus aestuarii]|uniref:LysR family transcriptional regulator n=1 Tax=Teichococcus aestuarii TaxID=568898 RepID=UPI00361DDB4F